jgi:hypothetical protein
MNYLIKTIYNYLKRIYFQVKVVFCTRGNPEDLYVIKNFEELLAD